MAVVPKMDRHLGVFGNPWAIHITEIKISMWKDILAKDVGFFFFCCCCLPYCAEKPAPPVTKPGPAAWNDWSVEQEGVGSR